MSTLESLYNRDVNKLSWPWQHMRWYEMPLEIDTLRLLTALRKYNALIITITQLGVKLLIEDR